jgi:hypothetical protein
MKDEKGRPTRLALSAAAWGEPVPQDASDAAKLAAKGRRMLERYENSKKSDEAEVEEKNYAIYSAMALFTLAFFGHAFETAWAVRTPNAASET